MARETGTLEWQTSLVPAEIHNQQVRCISARLGSSVQWHQDRRYLEPAGTTYLHKLPGVACSNLGSKILCKGSKRNTSTNKAGQLDSSSLHQQLRRHSIISVNGSSQSLVAVGSIQRSNPISGATTVLRMWSLGQFWNQIDWQLCTSSYIQLNQPEVGSPGKGPV